MNNLKISIITSVYNNKETIEEAIKSVLNQTYKNIEYIVVDGSSSDGTIDIIKDYEGHITTFVSEADSGIYDGLNKGISLASGDVIGFLHGDDIYASDSIIEDIVVAFEKDSNLDAIYGDLIYTPRNNTTKVLRYWKSREFHKNLLVKGWMPAHPTFFVKKKIYEKYNNFDTTFKIAADYDFMLRVLSAGIEVKYLSKIIYKMRVGGKSNKSIKNILLKSKEDLKALKNNNIGGYYTLAYKNLSKIVQFIQRK